MMADREFDYDKFLSGVMSIPSLHMPTWIPCRSAEEAMAFAQWCVDNEIEEPRVVIFNNGNSGVIQ